MKKIILKCKLGNRDAFEDKLTEIDLDFSSIYWLHDRIYTPRGYKYGMNFPRIILRTEMHAVDEPPKYSIVLKRHIEDSGIDIAESTPIGDYSSAADIILQLGFKPAGEVSRRRQDIEMGEGTIIYLDSLDGTNDTYAKIETELQPNESITVARQDLEKTFKTLGETDVIESAYFEL